MKSQYIHIRIAPDEKELMRAEAKNQGFETISGYLLWLWRQDMRNLLQK